MSTTTKGAQQGQRWAMNTPEASQVRRAGIAIKDVVRELLAHPCADCEHTRERHDIEPPYQCYDCNCGGFAYLKKEPKS